MSSSDKERPESILQESKQIDHGRMLQLAFEVCFWVADTSTEVDESEFLLLFE